MLAKLEKQCQNRLCRMPALLSNCKRDRGIFKCPRIPFRAIGDSCAYKNVYSELNVRQAWCLVLFDTWSCSQLCGLKNGVGFPNQRSLALSGRFGSTVSL